MLNYILVPINERFSNYLLYDQNSAFPGVLGKPDTSLMFSIPVVIMMSLSNPSPKPPWGTVPCFLKSRYHQ